MPETSDRDELRLLHFEDCRSAIDQLFKEALKSSGLSAFNEFLDFVTKFNNLSVYNAMLVRLQRPGASAVGTRKQWKDKGRHVNPDAVPLVVLHPFGPVRFVYEVADTTGKPLPGEDNNVLYAEGNLDPRQYRKTLDAAKKYGIDIIETDQYGSLLAGTAAGIEILPESLGGKAPFPFRVKVNVKHDLTTRFSTLAHELGHVYCGHLGAGPKGRWPARMKLSKKQKELEAEAVSWLVCQRNGIRSRSRDYLASLISGADIEGVSMYAIFDASNRVESRTSPTQIGGHSPKINVGSEPIRLLPSEFDKETYAAIKSQFITAYSEAVKSGHSAREFVRLMVTSFGPKIKPYVSQFMKDVRDGVTTIEITPNAVEERIGIEAERWRQ